MDEGVSNLLHELEQIAAGKGVQPNWKNKRAAARAAQTIRELYANQESSVDSPRIG